MWSHKIQEKQCDIYTKQYRFLETLNIISASITSVGILSLIFTNQFWIKIISAILSFVTIFVSAYFKSFDLHQMTLSNKTTANKLLCIRDQLYLIILKIHMECDSANDLLIQYEKTLEELDEIYQSAPNLSLIHIYGIDIRGKGGYIVASPSIIDGNKSVSYTHLDVYKRQSYESSF